MRSLDLFFGKRKRSTGRLVELFERLGKQLPARLRERIPGEQLLRILLHGATAGANVASSC